MTSLAVAAVLFLLTLSLAYAFWYRIRFHRKDASVDPPGKKPDGPAVERAAEPQPTATKKYKKGDYCYPGINDVMGFEFVKVISVPENLKPPTAVHAPAPAPEPPAWDKTPSLGAELDKEDEEKLAVEAAPAEASREDIQNLDDQDTARAYDHYVEETPERPVSAPADEGEPEEENGNDLSDEDYFALSNGAANIEWPENVNDDTLYDDYLDDNPDMVDNTDSEREAVRLAAEKKDMEEYEKMINDVDFFNDDAARRAADFLEP